MSDLEVNQNDISNLVGAIRTDLARGAAVGVLAMKLPFEGEVFNATGRVIHSGGSSAPSICWPPASRPRCGPSWRASVAIWD